MQFSFLNLIFERMHRIVFFYSGLKFDMQLMSVIIIISVPMNIIKINYFENLVKFRIEILNDR